MEKVDKIEWTMAVLAFIFIIIFSIILTIIQNQESEKNIKRCNEIGFKDFIYLDGNSYCTNDGTNYQRVIRYNGKDLKIHFKQIKMID